MTRTEEITDFILKRQQTADPFAFMIPKDKNYHIRIDVEFTLKEVTADNLIVFSYRVHESLEGNINQQIHLVDKFLFQNIEDLVVYLMKKDVNLNIVRATHL